MEKKKLLFVAITVGIFLAFTIGAALLVFIPRSGTPAATAGLPSGANIAVSSPLPQTGLNIPEHPIVPQPAPIDAADMVRRNGDVPGIIPLPDGVSQQTGAFHVQGQPGITTETRINVPKPTAAAVPDTPPTGRAAPRSVQTQQPRSNAQPAPNPQAAAAQTTTGGAPVQKKPAPATPAASQIKPAQTKTYDDFWVQTGAFSTVINAEGVRETLASRGITSIIDNRVIDGLPLFRVRVGPYTSMNEANYWLSLIKSIEGFEDSQVRQTQTLR